MFKFEIKEGEFFVTAVGMVKGRLSIGLRPVTVGEETSAYVATDLFWNSKELVPVTAQKIANYIDEEVIVNVVMLEKSSEYEMEQIVLSLNTEIVPMKPR